MRLITTHMLRWPAYQVCFPRLTMPFFIGYYLSPGGCYFYFILWGNQAARGLIDFQPLHSTASVHDLYTMLHLSLFIGIAVLDSARLDWVAVLASYQEPSTACSDWPPLPRFLGGWCQSDCWRRADRSMNHSWLERCEVDQIFWGFTTADFLLRSGPQSSMN